MIKNIIFDLGGVIININPVLTIQAFRALGFEVEDNIFKMAQNKLLRDIEIGAKDPKHFFKDLMKEQQLNHSSEVIRNAWELMLLDIPAERIYLLHTLKEKYNLFLLSNTNKWHIERINLMLQHHHNVPSLEHLFHKIYLSYELGMVKPDLKIFKYILKDNNISAEETLFIDDSETHLKSASDLGIKTAHVNEQQSITDIFTKKEYL